MQNKSIRVFIKIELKDILSNLFSSVRPFITRIGANIGFDLWDERLKKWNRFFFHIKDAALFQMKELRCIQIIYLYYKESFVDFLTIIVSCYFISISNFILRFERNAWLNKIANK